MSLREFTTAPPRHDASATPTFDPLRYCIFTTIALLAWLFGPAVIVVAISAIGLAAYWRAWRAGLTRSRCVLGDTRLVMLYLALACAGGLASLIYRFAIRA
jgi:hypothetical protein